MAVKGEPCFECTVRFYSGTHVTNVVDGHRASSTSDPQRAAQNLGLKVYGDKFSHAELLHHDGAGISQYRVYRKGVGR